MEFFCFVYGCVTVRGFGPVYLDIRGEAVRRIFLDLRRQHANNSFIISSLQILSDYCSIRR
jgi:hypothetical protein